MRGEARAHFLIFNTPCHWQQRRSKENSITYYPEYRIMRQLEEPSQSDIFLPVGHQQTCRNFTCHLCSLKQPARSMYTMRQIYRMAYSRRRVCACNGVACFHWHCEGGLVRATIGPLRQDHLLQPNPQPHPQGLYDQATGLKAAPLRNLPHGQWRSKFHLVFKCFCNVAFLFKLSGTS
jgi:hypothetical protein